MRKSVFKVLKALFFTALTAAAIASCQDDKPQINLPEPIIPQPEFKYVESLTPDTLKFRQRDSLVFNIRTIPYDLLNRDSITIQLTDTAGAYFQYAQIKSWTLRADSIWNIVAYISEGIKSGQTVSLMVADKDTVLYSDPIVLYIIPKAYRALETVTPDTLAFHEEESDSVIINIRTIPIDLLDSADVTISILDSTGQVYPYAEITNLNLRNDSIWDIVTHIMFGMETGDVIQLMVTDAFEDTVIYSRPIVLRQIPKPEPIHYSVMLVSDSISAFLKGGQATIRVKTTPWNILFTDTICSYALVDMDGLPVDDRLSIDSIAFVSSDSSWSAKINTSQCKDSEVSVRFMLTCPDTVVVTEPALLKKVSFKMSSVKTGNNLSMKFTSSTSTYSYCLPTTTDFSAQKFLFTHTGDKVTVGDSVLENYKYATLDASKPITVSVWKYDIHIDYILKLTNTGLPVVRINTNGQSVTRRDTWVTGTTMRIELPDGTVDYEGPLSIKGRGNGTWTDFPKKPYALRLDEKSKILGMHKQKRWILLANYKDRTLMRNDVSFWLSRQTEMPYTVSGEFVELEWNGTHMGNYYLCEQARIDDHRIDIKNPNLQDPEKGGFFMEIDAFLDYTSADREDKEKDVGFRSTGANSRYKLPYIFKDPDEDENGVPLTSSSAAFTYMKNYVKNMEDAIYAASSTNHEWQKYLDMDAAIDYALIQELTMNHDSYNTWPGPGPHSAFLYKDSCGLLCFGPTWDFDYHTFTLYGDFEYSYTGWNNTENARIKQWEILKMDSKEGNTNKYYFSDLVKKDPQFKARLLERWNMYKDVWKEGFPAYVDEVARKIEVSETYNNSKWGYPNKQNGDNALSFKDAVSAMKTAFQKRWQWMDENLSKLGN